MDTQREIKFRFLRTDINSDKFWEYRIFPDDLYNNDWSDLGANFSTLSQYTGLKDKNGREIYEGDIVKTTVRGECEVIWNELFNAFRLAYHPELPLTGLTLEIIGNIYENPELLK